VKVAYVWLALFSAHSDFHVFATSDRLSPDLNLFPPLPSTNSSSLFLFCPEDEAVVLLVLIPDQSSEPHCSLTDFLFSNTPARDFPSCPKFHASSEMCDGVQVPVNSNLLMMEPLSDAFDSAFFTQLGKS
jgi:hypothetical protein